MLGGIYALTNVSEYISLLIEESRKSTRLDATSLDIIGQFAWEKYLSAYQIYSKLKYTPSKLAYKNVNKRINTLLLSGLIKEAELTDINNKHRAKYYALTEYGIYRLFLNRLNSFIANQAEVRKERKSSPSSNALTFLQNYSDSSLFQSFLYPYFKKETLFAVGASLLLDLYGYLSTCCESIQRDILGFTDYSTRFQEKIFSWEKVPGKDNMSLLLHLQHIFKLKPGSYQIKKEDNTVNPTITISAPCAPPIVLKLTEARDNVVIMSTAGGQYKELEYDVHEMYHEMWVSKRIPSKESVMWIVDDAEMNIEELIYRFVYRMASSAPEKSKEFSYYCEILSKDDKFMRMVEKIHEDKHKGFETGYKKLTNKN
jgi:hypothetical protein